MPSDPRNPLDPKFVLLFVLAAYGSYLFHEFGHWSIGEILGNDMSYSLNYVSPRSGSYLDASHDLYSSIGGPAFSLLQALIALLLIEKYQNLSIYPFAFSPMYSRFFSLAFGGFEKQDEARIAVLLGAGRYTVATAVVAILVLIVVRCSSTLTLDLKKNGSIAVLATLCQLLVIGTYELFSMVAVLTGLNARFPDEGIAPRPAPNKADGAVAHLSFKRSMPSSRTRRAAHPAGADNVADVDPPRRLP